MHEYTTALSLQRTASQISNDHGVGSTNDYQSSPKTSCGASARSGGDTLSFAIEEGSGFLEPGDGTFYYFLLFLYRFRGGMDSWFWCRQVAEGGRNCQRALGAGEVS